MDIVTESPYFRADQIRPGLLYLASRGDDIYLVLGVVPYISGDASGICTLKVIQGSAFSEFLVTTGQNFSHNSRFKLVDDCKVVPTQSVEHWRMSSGNSAEIGSVYSGDESLFLVARNKEGSKIIVDLQDGVVQPLNHSRFMWTGSWAIVQKDLNGFWVRIFER